MLTRYIPRCRFVRLFSAVRQLQEDDAGHEMEMLSVRRAMPGWFQELVLLKE
jgi:hypothetical protein